MKNQDWVNIITAALEGKSPELCDVEIRGEEGTIYIVIPPGRRLFPDDDDRLDVSDGWTFHVEGSGYFDEYGTLAELVEAENDDWEELIWPK